MILGQNVLKGKSKYSTPDEAREFVLTCENDFEGRLDVISDRVASNREIKIVALSGPSCSGKTTTANKLIRELESRGRKVHVVSIDDFYYDKEKLHEIAKEIGKLDYESIRSIDFEAFVECVEEIFNDGKTRVPRFDFKQGRRVGYVEYDALDDDIFIFEGIQAIYPEILKVLSKYPSVSICICVMSSIEIDGKIFEPNEIRFMRRVVRDYHFRNSSAEFTMELWEGVRENEDVNIFPYIDSVDMQIDSTLAFELSMLKPYLDSILPSISEDSKYSETARNILDKIKDIEPLPRDYISENSLYNEFI
jgi:uridine kinase